MLSTKPEQPYAFNCVLRWKEFDEAKFIERSHQNLESCLKAEQTNSDTVVLDFIGLIYYSKADYIKAERYFEKSLKLEPENYVALSNLGYLLSTLKRVQDANVLISRLKQIPEHKKSGIKSWSLAFYYLRMYENFKAIQHFDEALKYLPNEIKLKLYKANCLRRDGKHKKTIKILEPLLKSKLDKNSTIYLCAQLGKAYIGLAESKNKKVNKQVLEYLELGLKLDPSHQDLLECRANFWAKAGDIKKSIECYDEIIKDNPSTYSYQHRAALHRKIENFTQTEQDLVKALEMTPENYTAAIDLVILRHNLQKHEAVISDCNRLTSQRIGLYNLIRILYYQGLSLLAKDEIEAAEEIFFKLFYFYNKKADFGKEMGALSEYRDKVEFKLKAIYIQKYEEPELSFKIIKLKVKVKNYDEAQIILDTLFKRDPSLAEVLYYQAFILNREESYKEAAEKLLAIEPGAKSVLKWVAIENYYKELHISINGLLNRESVSLDEFRLGFKALLILYQEANSIQITRKLCEHYSKVNKSELNYFPTVSQVKVAAFLFNHLKESQKNPDDFQVERNNISHFLSLHSNSEQSLNVLSSAAINSSSKPTFSQLKATQLGKLGEIEFGLRCLELTNSGTNDLRLKKLVKYSVRAIIECRELLDHFFIAFCRNNFGKEIDFAPFPCVPIKENASQSIKYRLQKFLEEKATKKLKSLGLAGFVSRFEPLFNYLLSIQPSLENAKNLWLAKLYALRNKLSHDHSAGQSLEYDLEGIKINLLDFSFEVIRGVYQIIEEFYVAAGNKPSLHPCSKEIKELYDDLENMLNHFNPHLKKIESNLKQGALVAIETKKNHLDQPSEIQNAPSSSVYQNSAISLLIRSSNREIIKDQDTQSPFIPLYNLQSSSSTLIKMPDETRKSAKRLVAGISKYREK